jgi:hypothetical protein
MSKVLKKTVNICQADVLRMETEILFSFNFDLVIITPLHFVYSILSQGCVFEFSDSLVPKLFDNYKPKKEPSLQMNDRKIITNKVLDSMKKYAEFFADLATHLYELRKFKCS